ncbi:hypothetical protein DOTSEDRAFT_45787 [Dothistroma septosporum NZE10]|uniref:Uncharacterized protein n=1 Tax=Dothistroma septosporum (strain NZE10 / CBS 128990) TaxID=675120 RepID=N1PJE0_DOTSN|nr:hypothetical protein DOTSEDRAFT_45787 [Dothistroma septosporum NZE10]
MVASKACSGSFTPPAELRGYILELVLAEEKVQVPDKHADWEVDHIVAFQNWQCCDDSPRESQM